jgi:hypothetical protein
MPLTHEYVAYVEYCQLDEVTFWHFLCNVCFDLLLFLIINYIEVFFFLQLWFQKYSGFIEPVFCQCVVLKFDILISHF